MAESWHTMPAWRNIATRSGNDRVFSQNPRRGRAQLPPVESSQIRRPPRGGLLLLLRMKRCLLHLQIRDQLLDPVNCELVADFPKAISGNALSFGRVGHIFAHREYMRRVVKLFLPVVSSFAIIRAWARTWQRSVRRTKARSGGHRLAVWPIQRTVGGSATPAARSERLAAGRGAERSRRRLPSCSISVSVSASRSAMSGTHFPT